MPIFKDVKNAVGNWTAKKEQGEQRNREQPF
jgi:hypothetical protein